MKLSLRSARVNINLSVEEVAKALGVTRQTIYNWEQGKHNPSQKQIVQLAEMYGIRVGDIKWD